MRKLSLRSAFTVVAGKEGRIKAIKILLLVILCCICRGGYAAVTVTPASGGTAICSSKALGGTAPAYTTLGAITITEGNTADIFGPATDVVVLTAPAGWQFNAASPVSYGFTTGSNVYTVTGSVTSTTLTVNISVNGIDGYDLVQITGLQVQATSTSSTARNIYCTSITGGSIAGIVPGAGTPNFGSLSLTPPVTPSVTIAASPAGPICAGTNVVFTPTPTGGGATPAYQWYLNGTNVSTGATYANTSLTNGNTLYCVMTSSSGCVTATTATSGTTTMIVNPDPLPIAGSAVTCTGGTTTLSDATGGGTWSSSNTGVATIDASGNVSGVSVGTSIITYFAAGCPSTTTFTVNNPPLAPVITPSLTTLCSGGVATISATGTPAPAIVLSQTFNSGLGAWTVDNSGGSGMLPGGGWKVCGNGYPTLGPFFSPDYSAFAMSNADTSPSTSFTSSKLISPVFSLVAYSGATLTFQQAYQYWPAGDFNVDLDISTDGGTTWATMQNFVGASIGTSTGFISETFSLNGYLGQPNLRIRFYYYTHWGDFWAIDNVMVAGVSSVVMPAWSPATDLYADAGLTTPYVAGTPDDTVYVHPPSITTTGTIIYTATATSSGCVATGNSTVNFTPSPSPVTGNTSICVGTSTNLSDITTSGTWASANAGIATVVSGTGVVTGASPGTVTISYALGTGCTSTAVVTVNMSPGAISGARGICLGSSGSLSDPTTTGGAWASGNTAVATIGSSSGFINSVSTGTATITYTLGSGCFTTTVITINPLPTAILGTATVCMGLSTDLSDVATAGTWMSGSPAIAAMGTGSGTVFGLAPGTANITYTLGTGCITTRIVTVNPLYPITGTISVCAGSATHLTDAAGGGTWSSDNLPVATAAAGGVITGVSQGNATISYILATGCTATAILTVNALPQPVGGNAELCVSSVSTLTDATGGGVWSSGNTSVALIGPTTGTVAGILAGTSVITYQLSATGCQITTIATVDPLPAPIAGVRSVCAGLTTQLSDTSPGGTWTSNDVTIATIASGSGLVTGVAANTVLITYALVTGCAATTIVTVNPLPTAILGGLQVCMGSAIGLSDSSPGGTWTSSNTSVATVTSSGFGIVIGLTQGTTVITYTLPTGCLITVTVTVNPLPGTIGGAGVVCAGSAINLTDASGSGTWSSSNTLAATVGSSSGVVTGVAAGTASVIYTLPTNCTASKIITVNPLPAAITGSLTTCVGQSTVLTDGTGGGTWSSGNVFTGTVGSASGAVTGIAAGTVNITYTLGTGCVADTTVTVNALPPAISGSRGICQGATTTLTDAITGGTWVSGNVSTVFIGSSSGFVIGVSAGTSNITYTDGGTGCAVTAAVTINPLPVAISGASGVCTGAATILTDGTGGGSWSGSTSVATVGSGGSVTGIAAGTVTVIYTLPTGCTAAKTMTVNQTPSAITGNLSLCQGTATILSDPFGGGAWNSGTTSVAIIGASSGVAVGLSNGTSNITYTLTGGCSVVSTMTINLAPASITGISSMCGGTATTLSDVSSGGSWSSSNPLVATIGTGTGIITGLSAGTTSVSYTLSDGCATGFTFTVNTMPAPITGPTTLCQSQLANLSDAVAGGSWSSSNTSVASVGTGTGIVTGVGIGAAVITYGYATGCRVMATVTVNAMPLPVFGNSNVCQGFTTTFSDASAGGTWSSSNTIVATIGSTGLVNTLSVGATTISYSFSSGCAATVTLNSNPQPSVIDGTTNICAGSVTTLTDSIGSGNWSSSNPAVATVGPASGLLSGAGGGTAIITYSLGAGCITTTIVTVNLLPSSISGTAFVCAGFSTSLSDPYGGGGTWSSSDVSLATVGSATGVVNGISTGIVTITYSLGAGCTLATIVTVNPLPATITQAANLCYGATTQMSDATPGGTWSSSNPLVAPVGLMTGIVAGSAAGTVNITYKLGTGCLTTSVVTVYPVPAGIAGTPSVCAGLTASLSNATGGGTWSTGNSSVATVGSASGIVNGLATGNAAISYVLATGCYNNVLVTVNPLPPGITGNTLLCAGTTTNLTDAATGGTWSSGNTIIAMVGSATGIVSGVSAGTAGITYILPTGCLATTIVTVQPLPVAITGGANVCVGSTINISDATGAGTWSSSNTAIAWIGTSSGIVLGVSGGTAVITYVINTGCINTLIVTVTPLPPAISGPAGICIGATAVLTDVVTPGTWASSNIGVAAIGATTGNVMGITAGTANITYTIPIAPGMGCITFYTITVNPIPLSISGTKTVCYGLTTALSDATAGGTWSSSNAGIAAVGSTGVVAGSSAGTAAITYTIPAPTGGGCSVNAIVTVNPLPSAITGIFFLCSGSTTSLTDASAGGAWSSLNTGVASISSGSGNVTGNLAGTATIVYTLPTGCVASQPVTVNPMPSVISGAATVCQGLTIILSDATGGGTWASNNLAVATINSATGVLSGVSPGTATITYTLSTGCNVTAAITVNPLPAAITGNAVFCVGLTTNLSDASAGGTWSSGDVSVATAATATGVVTGIAAGTDNITYTLPTGCIASTTVTVNTIAAITGNPNVCLGYTTSLSDVTGVGTWSSSNAGVAGVGPATGVVSGISSGTSAISYVLSAGCIATVVVTVNSLPSPISGTRVVCAGLTTTLSDAFAGGTWSSSNMVVGTIDPIAGIVHGISAGTTTITYTIGSGCTTFTNATVNPLPAAIGGTTELCYGLTTTLTDITGGGTWSSSNASVAAIASSGIVTGAGAGSATITYTLPTGCLNTTSVLVDPLPSAIGGIARVCAGLAITLTDAAPGGTWSSTAVVLSVSGSAGAVTGISAGTGVVTYTLPTGCMATIIVTVYPLPAAITGIANVCAGSTTVLTDITPGGTWSSSDVLVAIAGAGTGTVGGASAGDAVITYMLPTGCIATANVTVNPLPQAINGVRSVCLGLSTNLTDSTSGGTWSSGSPGIESVGSSTGTVTGVAVGAGAVTYALPTGCITICAVTVNPLPAAITGPLHVCAGLTINLSDATAGGSWSSASPGISGIGSATGVVTGVSAGTSVITYTLNTGCINTLTITVNPLPAPVTGAAAICAAATTVLSDATTGGSWNSGAAGVATIGAGTGMVTGISAGAAGITYTLGTGCIAAYIITVNPLPAAISGTMHVCAGLTTTLSDFSSGGSWGSGSPATGSIGSAGIVTGISAGTTMITYAFPTGCNATAIVTVNSLPAAITGASSVCTGSTVALTDITTGGSWSIAVPAGVAAIGSATGVVSGISAGTAIVTYTLSTGCIATIMETVFASPSPITGTLAICEGQTSSLTNATASGTWSSSNTTIAVADGTTGVVTGISPGTSMISYTLGSGCFAVKVVTIDPLPSVISGDSWLCTGVSYPLSDSVAGGNWSSGTTGVAVINAVTGLMQGVATGNAAITYRLPTGCISTLNVTVNASPAAILGATRVCAGASVTISDVSAGGTWSSSNDAMATAGSGSGIVNGLSAGSVVITYELPTGCTAITGFTVNPLPSVIAGNRSVCLGSSSHFSDTLAGGTWSVSSSAIAVIGTASGIAAGAALGTAIITYTLPTGCIASAIITVNPYPVAITGASVVCQGSFIYLSDATAGGTWSSGNPAIASAGSATGTVTGASGGAVTITYTMSTGCFVTKVVTVNPIFPIAGATGLCVGSSYVFSDLVSGGAWSSNTATVASIGSGSGIAMAVASGITVISYLLPSGCSAAVIVTVNVVPASFNITGGGSYCAGGTGLGISLNGSGVGVSYNLYNGASFVAAEPGTGAALSYGPFTAAGSYSVLAVDSITGCSSNMTGAAIINVTPISAPSVTITTTIGDTVCEGSIAIFKAIPAFGGSTPMYSWFVNGLGVTGSDSAYAYAPLNGDVLSVTMASNAACVMPATASATFSVTTTPNVAPSVTISASPGDSICAAHSVTIIPDPVNGGSLPTYRWMKNGINAGWGSTYTYLPLNGDNIFCAIHSNYHCLSIDTAFSSNNINMTVIPLLTPVESIAAYPGGALAPGQPDTLIATVTNGGTGISYQWKIDGIAVSGATSDTFVSSSLANNDTVSCTTSGGSYCGEVSAEAQVVISINNTEVSIMSPGISGVRLIPNPNNGTFTVTGNTGSDDGPVSIEITDMVGQVVCRKTLQAINGKFSEKFELANSLANGAYLLNLSGKANSNLSDTGHIIFHFIISK